MIVQCYLYLSSFCFSSKRRSEYKDFQLFVDVDQLEILKHCPTRWLSLEKVVKRTLQQYPALLSYFTSHAESDKPGRVKRIKERLEDSLTKLTLLFLQHILPVLNDFNKVFQADETKVGLLLPETDRLLRKFLGKFVQLQHVKGHTLSQVDFTDRDKQHNDSTITVGMEARSFFMDCIELTPSTQRQFLQM